MKSVIFAAALALVAVACSAAPGPATDTGASGSSSGGGASSSGGSSSGGSSSGASGSGGRSSSGDGGSSSGASSSGASGSGGRDGGSTSSSGGSSSGGSSGGPITCPGPGNYKKNGGACGSERWDIKVGMDQGAAHVSLAPQTTTIAALVAVPPNGGGAVRSSPYETTLWELKDVTLSMIKLETDSDYHIVLSDGPHTMIVEVPYPPCGTSSAWACFLSRARSEVDAQLSVSSSPQYPAQTVTVRGVGFFDVSHGQTGVAPNAIELHAVLEICFGKGCTPS